MPSQRPLLQKLISIIEPVLEADGYELVDLRFILEQGGWILRVCVDRPPDPSLDVGEVPPDRVDLSDCETVSRQLSAVLDVDDPIAQAYSLEVSSPGIDRPLRTAKHFTHFAGSDAKITMAVPLVIPDAPERRNFRGVLRGLNAEGDQVAIDVDGQRFELPLVDIDSAKLVPDWDAVMRGKSGAGGKTPKPVKPGHRPSQKKRTSNPSGGAQGAGGPNDSND
ncbi:MAG: ribosome maturation factor RimP [Deltaproteobacteria bacterium]|nr:ribosome maturation factor RimP [Deltaproteobacteria bacterium]